MSRAGILQAVALLGMTTVLAGCSTEAPIPLEGALHRSLDTVTGAVRSDAGLMIQDVSPRVGLDSSFSLSTSDQTEWTVVAICADEETLREADAIEVAVIPSEAHTRSVREDIDAGEFRDAVTCDGLPHS